MAATSSIFSDERRIFDEESFIQNRVFMNHVDTLHARRIASKLADEIHGELFMLRNQAGEGEDEDEKDKDEGQPGEGVEGVAEPEFIPPITFARYEIIGTLSAPYMKPSEDIKYIIDDLDDIEWKNEILRCGYIIWDISYCKVEIMKAFKVLRWIISSLNKAKDNDPENFDVYPVIRTFVLISNCMTWGNTPPKNKKNPKAPFIDDDYASTRRLPVENYERHFHCEEEVLAKGRVFPSKLKTYVVCSGIVYGHDEDELFYFFEKAWLNQTLPIFGLGDNTIPFIHADDLARIIIHVMELKPKEDHYLLASEKRRCNQTKFIKALAKHLGNGFVSSNQDPDDFDLPETKPVIEDIIMINMNWSPIVIEDTLEVEFESDLNIVDNMKQVVDEFRKARRLIPVKVAIHGPPCIGKTLLAKRLANYYKCRHLTLKTVIELTIIQLEMMLDYIKLAGENEEAADAGEGEEGTGKEEKLDPTLLYQQLDEIKLMKTYPKFPDDYNMKLLKDCLFTNHTKNQGYILDDFPSTIDDAKEVFGIPTGRKVQVGEGGDNEDEGGGEEGEAPEKPDETIIMPKLIVELVADDEWILNRHALLYYNEPQGESGVVEDSGLESKLIAYREINAQEDTILTYFDEQEVDILVIDITRDNYELRKTFDLIIKKIGPIRDLGPTRAEIAQKFIEDWEKQQEENARKKLEDQVRREDKIKCHKDNMENWLAAFEYLLNEEEKIVTAKNEPLRFYLMKYIFPAVTKAMVCLLKTKPQDPIDFLAEVMFQYNEDGTMFDPSFSVEGECIFNYFKKAVQDKLDNKERYLTSRQLRLCQHADEPVDDQKDEEPPTVVKDPRKYHDCFLE